MLEPDEPLLCELEVARRAKVGGLDCLVEARGHSNPAHYSLEHSIYDTTNDAARINDERRSVVKHTQHCPRDSIVIHCLSSLVVQDPIAQVVLVDKLTRPRGRILADPNHNRLQVTEDGRETNGVAKQARLLCAVGRACQGKKADASSVRQWSALPWLRTACNLAHKMIIGLPSPMVACNDCNITRQCAAHAPLATDYSRIAFPGDHKG